MGFPQVYGFVQVVIKYRSHRDCKLTIVILIVFVCLNNEKGYFKCKLKLKQIKTQKLKSNNNQFKELGFSSPIQP